MKLDIRKHLKAAGMNQAALADAVDIKPGFLSEILSGKKNPSLNTLEAIAAALNVQIADLFAGETPDTGSLTGMAEAEAEPFKPAGSSALQAAIAALGSACRHAETYRIKKADPALALCEGDLLVIDMGAPVEPGALVIATIADFDSGAASTIVRRYVPGWLFGPGNPVQIDNGQNSVGVLGTVRSMIRTAPKG